MRRHGVFEGGLNGGHSLFVPKTVSFRVTRFAFALIHCMLFRHTELKYLFLKLSLIQRGFQWICKTTLWTSNNRCFKRCHLSIDLLRKSQICLLCIDVTYPCWTSGSPSTILPVHADEVLKSARLVFESNQGAFNYRNLIRKYVSEHCSHLSCLKSWVLLTSTVGKICRINFKRLRWSPEPNFMVLCWHVSDASFWTKF